MVCQQAYENQHMPDLSFEQSMQGCIAGIDEAGRGPWAGPVVASAVVLDLNNIPEGINDSKKLSAHKRENLYQEIITQCLVGTGFASVEEIDQLNILQATFLAMRRAFDELSKKVVVDGVLIDGNHSILLPCPVKALIKGDSLSLSIAAASIVAKVTRDRVMHELSMQCPQYGWERNAGYGTKHHQEALTSYGVTIHHRKTFAPIRLLLA